MHVSDDELRDGLVAATDASSRTPICRRRDGFGPVGAAALGRQRRRRPFCAPRSTRTTPSSRRTDTGSRTDSDESGSKEVYVRAFPADSGGYRRSPETAAWQPMWQRDQSQLFFLAPDGTLMSAGVSTAKGFEAGAPKDAAFRPEPPHPSAHQRQPASVRRHQGRQAVARHRARAAPHRRSPSSSTGWRRGRSSRQAIYFPGRANFASSICTLGLMSAIVSVSTAFQFVRLIVNGIFTPATSL